MRPKDFTLFPTISHLQGKLGTALQILLSQFSQLHFPHCKINLDYEILQFIKQTICLKIHKLYIIIYNYKY